MKKKDLLPHLITLIIAVLISSLVSVAATGNLFDSNEVVYDNTSSGMNSTNVKSAVDELYAAATDYSNISNRVTSLESYFKNNPTSEFDGHDLQIGKYETGDNYAFVDFWRNGKNRGGVGVDADTGNTVLQAKNTNGTPGTGILDIKGSAINLTSNSNDAVVKVNGSNVVTDTTKTEFSATKSISSSGFVTNKCYKIGNLCTCNFWLANLNATNFPAGTEVTLATIPAAYKPSYRLWSGVSYTGNGVTGDNLYVFMDENGNIVSRHPGTIYALMFSFTWVL